MFVRFDVFCGRMQNQHTNQLRVVEFDLRARKVAAQVQIPRCVHKMLKTKGKSGSGGVLEATKTQLICFSHPVTVPTTLLIPATCGNGHSLEPGNVVLAEVEGDGAAAAAAAAPSEPADSG
jgi:hypothetical protein